MQGTLTTASQVSLTHSTSVQFAVGILGALPALPILGRRRKLVSYVAGSLLSVAVGLFLVFASGYSGSSSTIATPPPSSEVGAYTFTVTAISGTLTHTSTYTLIIQ